VAQNAIRSCKALDVGCGTGDNSIWLAQNRFQVVGTDSSDIAIGKAKEKAENAGVECEFITADFFTTRIEAAPFGFVFDRGCFHSQGA
jgi:2-polyprenyl-3-methyl-5-hydroxy-6-metoxy-1,4-benzoquinol methylase